VASELCALATTRDGFVFCGTPTKTDNRTRSAGLLPERTGQWRFSGIRNESTFNRLQQVVESLNIRKDPRKTGNHARTPAKIGVNT